MAMPKVRARRIVVDGTVFLWRVPRPRQRNASYSVASFCVLVQSETRRGSVLSIHFDRHHPKAAQSWRLPVVAVLPSQIAAAIRRALQEGWQPTLAGANYDVGAEVPASSE